MILPGMAVVLDIAMDGIQEMAGAAMKSKLANTTIPKSKDFLMFCSFVKLKLVRLCCVILG